MFSMITSSVTMESIVAVASFVLIHRIRKHLSNATNANIHVGPSVGGKEEVSKKKNWIKISHYGCSVFLSWTSLDFRCEEEKNYHSIERFILNHIENADPLIIILNYYWWIYWNGFEWLSVLYVYSMDQVQYRFSSELPNR